MPCVKGRGEMHAHYAVNLGFLGGGTYTVLCFLGGGEVGLFFTPWGGGGVELYYMYIMGRLVGEIHWFGGGEASPPPPLLRVDMHGTT